MLIGVVGAPNKGKSTFFSALTSTDVAIADYPFTTIDPNRGVAYARVKCAHAEMGLPKCDARGGHCKNGIREIPVQLLDVAGLVPDAHMGKGMGNKFLDDLRQADALIQVIDASGRTDLEGKPCEGADLGAEVKFLQEEIAWWIAGILKRNWDGIRNRGIGEVADALIGFGAGREDIVNVAKALSLPMEKINWSDAEVFEFSKRIAKSKPVIIAANKSDLPGALEKAQALGKMEGAPQAIPCSAAYEKAARKASDAGVCDYRPGDAKFAVLDKANDKQRAALETMRAFFEKNNGSGVQRALHAALFEKLGMIVVYPVEDEHKFSDRTGHVLLDALLVPKGTTALGLAGKIHTDFAKNFIGAVDAKTLRRVGKEHVLADGDIIKIIAGK
jgi:ribosome-binding ATPase